MEMINRAVEEAAYFRGMMDKIEARADMRLAEVAAQGDPRMARQPGENRAEHRARLKRERRESKAAT